MKKDEQKFWVDDDERWEDEVRGTLVIVHWSEQAKGIFVSTTPNLLT